MSFALNFARTCFFARGAAIGNQKAFLQYSALPIYSQLEVRNGQFMASNNINGTQQKRWASSDIRPKKIKFKKSMKGYFPSRSGGSIRGTSVFLGDYGLQVIEGGRISDTHLDVARSAVRRALKNEKGSAWWMRAFPDRPVTSKPSEVRMGKGKGYVDFYATWLAEGRMVFEVKGTRPELAIKALKIASSFIPLRTRVIAAKHIEQGGEEARIVPPRVLPYFIKRKLGKLENERAKRDLSASFINLASSTIQDETVLKRLERVMV